MTSPLQCLIAAGFLFSSPLLMHPLTAGQNSPYESSTDEEKLATPWEAESLKQFGIGWIPDKGLVLRKGEGVYSRLPTWDTSEHADLRRTHAYSNSEGEMDYYCFTLKVQNDFDATDEEANPARFRWTKDAGEDDYWESDLALRLDAWIPGLYNAKGNEISLALGYELDRADLATEEQDLQRFHIGTAFAPKFLDDVPFLRSDQVMQIGATYVVDGISGENTWEYSFDYQPAFLLPKGGVGMRCSFLDLEPMDPSKPPAEPFYSINPQVGVSYGDRIGAGNPIAAIDGELLATYQLGVHLGIPLGEAKEYLFGAAEFVYTLKGATSLSGSSSFLFHEFLLKLQPSVNSPVSIDLAYQRGMDGFMAPDLDRFTVGFGVKF